MKKGMERRCGVSQRLKNKLSSLDKRILNRLQDDIPFVERTWQAIAGQLKIEEDILLMRIAFFKKKGIIRRISAVFAPRKINFASTLIAVKTSSNNINKVARKINFYPEVTHNYRRAAQFNIWFALVAKNKKRITQIITELKKDKDIKQILEFPAVRIFKINVKFPA